MTTRAAQTLDGGPAEMPAGSWAGLTSLVEDADILRNCERFEIRCAGGVTIQFFHYSGSRLHRHWSVGTPLSVAARSLLN
jgi:hypothetical protein